MKQDKNEQNCKKEPTPVVGKKPNGKSRLNPFRLNQRLRAQHGVFMVPGKVSKAFMEYMRALEGYNENCLKMVTRN